MQFAGQLLIVMSFLQAGEESKQKSYRAICELPEDVTAEHLEKINNTRDLLLAQNTPTRVAHRRALLVRERMVYTMHAERVPENPKQLVLELRTQVCFIKPNLSILLISFISYIQDLIGGVFQFC